jgi:hypothetical protein
MLEAIAEHKVEKNENINNVREKKTKNHKRRKTLTTNQNSRKGTEERRGVS